MRSRERQVDDRIDVRIVENVVERSST